MSGETSEPLSLDRLREQNVKRFGLDVAIPVAEVRAAAHLAVHVDRIGGKPASPAADGGGEADVHELDTCGPRCWFCHPEVQR